MDFLRNINLLESRYAAGVSLRLETGKMTGNYALLKRKGPSIDLENSVEDVSFNEILDRIPDYSPVSLSLDGKGVIYKKVKDTPEIRNHAVQHLFPDAQEDDFYTFQYPSDNGFFFACVIRKSILDEIIESFRSHGLFLIRVFIGPFALYNILPSIRKEDQLLKIPGYILEFKDQNIAEIKSNKEPVRESILVGKESIKPELLLPFASAISYFLSQKDEPNIIPATETSTKEFSFKQQFRLIGYGFLGLVFIVLIINFLFFSKYRTEYNELSSELSSKQNLINRLDTLQDKLDQRNEFIIEKGYLKSSRMSFYADRIAYTIPDDIMLTRLVLYPLEGKIKMNKEITFNQQTISLTGKAANSALLNKWIKQLQKKFKWIKKVTIINYTQEEYNNPGTFSLKIKIK